MSKFLSGRPPELDEYEAMRARRRAAAGKAPVPARRESMAIRADQLPDEVRRDLAYAKSVNEASARRGEWSPHDPDLYNRR